MTVLLGLPTRLRLARLGFVTDTRGGGPDWEAYCHDLFFAGVDLIIIEEPSLNREQLQEAVTAGLRAGFGRGRIIGLAQASAPALNVDLLHLKTREAVTLDRELCPLVGRPAQSWEEAQRWLADPELSYITVGPVRDEGEGELTRGLNLIARLAAMAPVADPATLPWFATGGIDATNVDAVLRAGARRLIVHRAIADAPDPATTAREWADRLRHLWREDPALKDYSLAIRRLDRGE